MAPKCKKLSSVASCFAHLFPTLSDKNNSRLEEPKCPSEMLLVVPEMKKLEKEDLELVTRAASLKYFEKNDFVTETGVTSDGLYIIVEGRAVTSSGEILEKDAFFGFPAHCESKDPPLRVSAESYLKCIFLKSELIQLLGLRPRMEYEYAVILHNTGREPEEEYQQQKQIIHNLLRAGIEVTILHATQTSRDKVVLLLSAPMWLLSREDKILKMERAVDYCAEEDLSSLGSEYDDRSEVMTAADRLQAFAHLLTRDGSREPRGAGLQGIEINKDPIVHSVFPLHDPSVNDFFCYKWTTDSNQSESMRRLIVRKIKNHFGVEAAFYFSYVRLYTEALFWPSLIGSLLWITWRWIDYKTYQAALGVFGMGMCLVWSPLVVKWWKRYQNELVVEWKLLQAREVEYENPNFKDYEVELFDVAGPNASEPDVIAVKSYSNRKRWPKFAAYFFFVVFCCLALLIFLGLYLQWYIVAVMTPVCHDPRCVEPFDYSACLAQCPSVAEELRIQNCEDYCGLGEIYGPSCSSFLGCFDTERGLIGTARWVYVFLQGVILGLTIDILFTAIFEGISNKFNEWENWRTIQDVQKHFVMKTFIFTWLGYFYWFLTLAFVYVPYGDSIQEWIKANIDTVDVITFGGNIQYARTWIPGRLAMDTAFVTPLIVTQGLNLFVNTFLPWIGRKAILAARNDLIIASDSVKDEAKKMKEVFKHEVHIVSERLHSPKRSHRTDGEESEISAVDVSVSSHTTEDGEETQETSCLATVELSASQVQEGGVGDGESGCHANALLIHTETMAPYRRQSQGLLDKLQADLIGNSFQKAILSAPSNTSVGSAAVVVSTASSSSSSTPHGDLVIYGDKHRRVLRGIDYWQCRSYQFNADHVVEEGQLSVWSPFSDLLHQCIQFSYITMFSVVWPFCALCGLVNNRIAMKFDAIKMVIDFKRQVPKRVVGIGTWEYVLLLEAMLAAMIVPGLYVGATGGYDAYWGCEVSELDYGPQSDCDAVDFRSRLAAFVLLENIGLAIMFFVHSTKREMSRETRNKIALQSRKHRHKLRTSVRLIGQTILVDTEDPVKWKEATVAWMKKGNQLKVAFRDESALDADSSLTANEGQNNAFSLSGLRRRSKHTSAEALSPSQAKLVQIEQLALPPASFTEEYEKKTMAGLLSRGSRKEVWLSEEKIWIEKTLHHVELFEKGAPVLLRSPEAEGTWYTGSITEMRNAPDSSFRPNRLLVTVVRATGLHLRDPLSHRADPFCLISCGSVGGIQKTSVRLETLQPSWSEQFAFNVDNPALSLKVEILNHRAISFPEMGAVEIPLASLASGENVQQWFDLKSTLTTHGNIFHTHRRSQASPEGFSAPISKKSSEKLDKKSKSKVSAFRNSGKEGTPGGKLIQPKMEGKILLNLRWVDTNLPSEVRVFVSGHPEFSEKWMDRAECDHRLRQGIVNERMKRRKNSTFEYV